MRHIQYLIILCVLSTMGCTSARLKGPDMSWLLPSGPPAQVVAVWEPAIKHEVGEEKAKRGFGGRVYFYERSGKKPIKVDGNIVVYAFDEEGRKRDDNKPTRSYVFQKEDVKKLYSKSKLGHSYNFWVPWDSEGADGKVKKISLIVRYVPDVGSSAVSQQVLIYLPGKIGQSELLARAEWDKANKQDNALDITAILKREPAPVNEHLIEANDNRLPAMQTSTFTLPDAYSRNLQKLPPQSVNVPAILPAGFVQQKLKEAADDEKSAQKGDAGKIEELKSMKTTDSAGQTVNPSSERRPDLRDRSSGPRITIDERGLIRAQ